MSAKENSNPWESFFEQSKLLEDLDDSSDYLSLVREYIELPPSGRIPKSEDWHTLDLSELPDEIKQEIKKVEIRLESVRVDETVEEVGGLKLPKLDFIARIHFIITRANGAITTYSANRVQGDILRFRQFMSLRDMPDPDMYIFEVKEVYEDRVVIGPVHDDDYHPSTPPGASPSLV